MTFFTYHFWSKIPKKEQRKKVTSWLEFERNNKSKKYEVEIIYNNAIYASKSKYHLLDLYYLVS